MSGQLHDPAALTPGERALDTHWLGGWMGPRAGLDDVERRKFLTLQYSNSDPSLVQPVANRYIDCAIMALLLLLLLLF
jgi:hypothetical protein